MAVFDAILSPANRRAVKTTVTAAAASAEIAFGENEIFAIVGDGAFTLRFGLPGAVGTPDATDWYVPAGATETFDIGRSWTSFKIYNPSATQSVDVWYMILSKF